MTKGKIQPPILAHHVQRMLTVLGYIEANLDEPLALAKLAKMACISPYYFHRVFTAYLSMPPREYIKYSRLTKSAKLLHYSHLSITEIAFMMGYEEASSFTRAFLQVTGKSPRAYRKETRHRLELMHQSMLSHQTIPQPQYLYLEEKTVFFRRKIGDYKVTVIEGIQECHREFGPLTCYGIALDDPLTISRERCRFDICVMSAFALRQRNLWGQRKLPGGKYALFIHRGPLFELEEKFTHFFYLWHSGGNKKLRFSGGFCEYVFPLDTFISSSTEVTAKYYVPLLE